MVLGKRLRRFKGWRVRTILKQVGILATLPLKFPRMKTSFTIFICLTLTLVSVSAQVATQPGGAKPGSRQELKLPPPTPFRIVGLGANNRLWQRESYEPAPDGKVVTRVHRYVELATGLHYRNEQGEWMESKEEIEAFAGGAIARHGQYQVIFANNLNTAGAIDQRTPEGKRLRSNILGLAYSDRSTGQSVLIAQIQDSEGELIAGNQVLYRNAFEGVKADIRYTYKRGSFEQDVLILEQLATPESYGMKSETTDLEVITEFIAPPKETITVQTQPRNALADEKVSWGVMRLGRGQAFEFGEPKGSRKPVSVRRHYATVDGRKILLEIVPLKAIKAGLSKLPQQASSKSTLPTMASKAPLLPKTPLAQAGPKPMKMAAIATSDQAFVLDYVEINTDQGNYTFQSDATYYISSEVNFDGDVTLERGTVIKLKAASAGINILGALNCQTTPYGPAVFTSADDNAVGEIVSATSQPDCTGNLDLQVVNNSGWNVDIYVFDEAWNTVTYGAVAAYDSGNFSFTAGLGQHYYFQAYDNYSNCYYEGDFYSTLNNRLVTLADDGSSATATESGGSLCTPPPSDPTVALALASGGAIHDVRISNVSSGVVSADECSVVNGQFVNCGTALTINNASLYVGNLLMSRVDTAFYGQNFQVTAENVTFDQGALVTDDPDGTGTTSALTLVNSMLTDVVDYGVVPVATSHVEHRSASGVYQAVGAGSYYLAINSPYRNAGTATIDANLLADLRTKTTYPPQVYADITIAVATNLGPWIQRDTNSAPSLGYHYDPLDYAFGGVNASSNLTFAAGTAVAWFELPGSWGNGYGISITNGKVVSFQGTVTAPCFFVRYSIVQEGGNGNWTDRSYPGGIVNQTVYDPNNVPALQATFTRFANLNSGSCHFRDGSSGQPLAVQATDCEILNAFGGYNILGSFTNCLLDRVTFWQGTASAFPYEIFRNCTFHGGAFDTVHWEGGAPYWRVSIRNCAFDGTEINTEHPFGNDPTYGDFDYNAFLTGANHPYPEGTHNQAVTSFNWQSSWLGDYYLPTSSALIDQGSTTANLISLYHFTTQANQVKEGNSTVDIGYHYVATDAYGRPLDTNGDGLPDYLEDGNGNGLWDSGEIDWNAYNLGLRVFISRPRNGANLY